MARMRFMAVEIETDHLSVADVFDHVTTSFGGAAVALEPARTTTVAEPPAPAAATPIEDSERATPAKPSRRVKRRVARPETAKGVNGDSTPVTPIEDSGRATAANGDTDLELLRAIARSDGKPRSLAAALHLADAHYRCEKALKRGLIVAEGATSSRKYLLSPAGQAAIGNGHGTTTKATRDQPTWTLEQRDLLRLVKQVGSMPVQEARDRLGWTNTIFERASAHGMFRVGDGLISVVRDVR